jgi:hypothetical protein
MVDSARASSHGWKNEAEDECDCEQSRTCLVSFKHVSLQLAGNGTAGTIFLEHFLITIYDKYCHEVAIVEEYKLLLCSLNPHRKPIYFED